MKKWIIYMLWVVFAATTASAQWWKLGLGDEESEQPQQQQMQRSGRSGGHRPQLSEEQRAKMKAEYEAIQKLADAARAETDPVKKAERVETLRARLTEGAEKKQAKFRKRLEQAEKGVEKMKARLAKAEKNQAQKVEDHLKKLLAGEKPKRHEGRHHGSRRINP